MPCTRSRANKYKTWQFEGWNVFAPSYQTAAIPSFEVRNRSSELSARI